MGTQKPRGKETAHCPHAESSCRSNHLCSLCSSPCHMPVLAQHPGVPRPGVSPNHSMGPAPWAPPQLSSVQCHAPHAPGVLGTHLSRELDARQPRFFEAVSPHPWGGESVCGAVGLSHRSCAQRARAFHCLLFRPIRWVTALSQATRPRTTAGSNLLRFRVRKQASISPVVGKNVLAEFL